MVRLDDVDAALHAARRCIENPQDDEAWEACVLWAAELGSPAAWLCYLLTHNAVTSDYVRLTFGDVPPVTAAGEAAVRDALTEALVPWALVPWALVPRALGNDLDF